MQAIALLNNDITSNFIPKSVQRTAAREKALRTASWLSMAAMLGAISVTGWVEYFVQDKTAAHARVAANIQSMQVRRTQLLSEARELAQLEKRLSTYETQLPPIPAWFLSHLGAITPPQAMLHSAELESVSGRWVFRLEGATAPSLAASATTLAEFESGLRAEQPPWRATMLERWRDRWVEHLRAGRAVDEEVIDFTLSGGIVLSNGQAEQ